jgi:3,4-dihydroxy 2-butanone 4-phosphate synthase/GTP cyclohydrolase II
MTADTIQKSTCARIPTPEGEFQLCHYVDTRDGKEHLALVMGDVRGATDVLTRVHSECFTGDVLGSQRCDCGEQLHQAMQIISAARRGVIIYLRQEGRGIGLADKLKAYNLQDQGYDTVDANLMLGHQADEREYSAAASILSELGIYSIRLMTNNPAKVDHLRQLGVIIEERKPLVSTVTPDNAAYLATKVQRMRHLLTLPLQPVAPDQNGPSPVDRLLDETTQRAANYYATTGRAYATLTYAQSIDGVIGSAGNGQLPISGPDALRITHALRTRHQAILVGIGTVLTDNPQLTARLIDGPQPQPIVLDSRLRMPLDARLWDHPKGIWIATTASQSPRAQALRDRGATLLALPQSPRGQVDLAALMALLGERTIASVMIEGGAAVLSSVLNDHIAQRAIITISPRFLGGQVQTVSLQGLPALDLHNTHYTRAGSDMLLWADLQPDPDPRTWTVPQLAISTSA